MFFRISVLNSFSGQTISFDAVRDMQPQRETAYAPGIDLQTIL